MEIVKETGSITENELISRIRNGEKELFEKIIRKNNPYLYKIGMSYGYCHEDVQDLMQETFIAAFLNLEKFEARSSFKTWITRIMLNQCYHKAMDQNAIKKKTDEIINEKVGASFQNDRSADAYRSVLTSEANSIVANALISIPLEYRMVFLLREMNEMSIAETAGLLDISETNVKVRLNRAKQMLRQKVEKVYTPQDIFEFNLIYCNVVTYAAMKTVNAL